MDSIIGSGTAGIQSGLRAAQRAAGDIAGSITGGIAGSTGESSDASPLAQSLVDLKLAERQVEASAEVIKTADEVLGTLIDTRA